MTTKLHASSVATLGLVSHPPPAGPLPRVSGEVAGDRRQSRYGPAGQATRSIVAGNLACRIGDRDVIEP
jgi:hypothetical protein